MSSISTTKIEMPGQIDLVITGLKLKSKDYEADLLEVKRAMMVAVKKYPNTSPHGDPLSFTVYPDGYHLVISINPTAQADELLDAIATELANSGFSKW